jgi:hypothetical protein
MAGLDPAIHVDPRVKPGGDGEKQNDQAWLMTGVYFTVTYLSAK